jgi:hypothetical protein
MINVGIRVIETGIINVAIITKKECDGLDKRNRAKEYAAIEWKDHDDEETGWFQQWQCYPKKHLPPVSTVDASRLVVFARNVLQSCDEDDISLALDLL